MSGNSNKLLATEQFRQRKLKEKGINLNVLVVGENGVGKRSFMNTLCKGDHYTSDVAESDTFLIEIKDIIAYLEAIIPIKLRVAMTQNFGFNLDNYSNIDSLASFVDEGFRSFLEQEIKIDRNPHFVDRRIHVALYFIRTSGRGLSELDRACMKKLGQKVNLIPILAKADGLTDDELELNKFQVMKSIHDNDIQIYDFADSNSCSDEDEQMFILSLQQKVPFAAISSNTADYKYRTTDWGTIVLGDEQNCDMVALEGVLFCSHLEQLKDTTSTTKYEQFRVQRLRK
ncbi:cell division/GTP binding protein [Suhomyces tanzawaensis NRRL Y-17324]|uniref:Cell division/GTP binding protein n=1 Tax=Suhomyces tanzawaensis NRRL Y-17324 TaxID=984487 RepID=A0A1E4SGM7_9ASCO|nr:cell division/GTP binding protein [Suhomyces tanzawaensis NRRL Y-17324]ODV78669.1 cell division/GTP binding protein [Suhomyces tanzawaensis NRRL Y-17324]